MLAEMISVFSGEETNSSGRRTEGISLDRMERGNSWVETPPQKFSTDALKR